MLKSDYSGIGVGGAEHPHPRQIALPRGGGQSASIPVTVDCSTAAPDEGKDFPVKGRYLAVESVPPGSEVIVIPNNTGREHRVSGGDTISFGGEAPCTSIKVRWTQIPRDEGAALVTLRHENQFARMFISDDIPMLPAVRRIYTVTAPARGVRTGQGIIAATGVDQPLIPAVDVPEIGDIEVVRISAHPDNVENLLVGEEGLDETEDGTGLGEWIPPGEFREYPVDNLGRLWIAGTLADRYCYCAPRLRR